MSFARPQSLGERIKMRLCRRQQPGMEAQRVMRASAAATATSQSATTSPSLLGECDPLALAELLLRTSMPETGVLLRPSCSWQRLEPESSIDKTIPVACQAEWHPARTSTQGHTSAVAKVHGRVARESSHPSPREQYLKEMSPKAAS